MQNTETLLAHSNKVFEAQKVVQTLWQTLAVHFYPARADFTNVRNLGEDISDELMDSYPVLMRRDLGNSIGSMLRDGIDWFDIDVRGGAGWDGRMWLEDATNTLRRSMNERTSGFMRSSKEADHDYITFGQAVMSHEPRRDRRGLLYRCWHLRDCAWIDGPDGQVQEVHRKWKPTASLLKKIFGDNVHKTTLDACASNHGMQEIEVRHIFMMSEDYGKDEFSRFKYVSVFIDIKNRHILEEVGINYRYYTVPRFQTISGSPYAYSAATMAALPNARMLQAMTHTLLEAAERVARPPIVATQRVVRSDIDLGPDSITWVDNEYDERLGASLRPLYSDKSGFPIGYDMRQGVIEILGKAFFLDKLNLPEIGREMTAYEVSERMKQYRREALPLFTPIESDYNGQIVESSFEIALQFGMLGSIEDIPVDLQGAETEYKFKSPLATQEDEKKAQQFSQVSDLLGLAAQTDPGVRHNIDFDTAFRDAVSATGAPTRWIKDMQLVAQGRLGDAIQQAGVAA